MVNGYIEYLVSDEKKTDQLQKQTNGLFNDRRSKPNIRLRVYLKHSRNSVPDHIALSGVRMSFARSSGMGKDY